MRTRQRQTGNAIPVFVPKFSCLVPASSVINSIDEIDRPGVRLLVPTRSAH